MNNITMPCQEIRDNDRQCQRDHMYAQQLNNAAASCIESGEHDKAVTYLVKALCISRTNKATLPNAMCECSTCSLDECIAYSEERASLHQNAEIDREDHQPKSKRRKIESNTYIPRVADTPNEGYTHKRPIMVPPSIITEGHILGPILALIITFNLALANHLKLMDAVASENHNTTKSVVTRERLGKVLRLYELAYRWEGELSHRKHCNNNDSSSCSENQQQPPQDLRKEPQQEQQAEQPLPQQGMKQNSGHDDKCSSLRFDMIVCNNLSQIHQMAQNYSKQEKCLQHLLSIMMFVVDWQRERANSEDAEHDEEEFEEQQQQSTSPSEESNTQLAVENDDCTTPPPMPVDTVQGQQQQQQQRRSGKRKRSVTYMDLDGFLRNVSPFVLKDDCAEAA
mmetsp:Transcript_17271/g.43093  ORF Transcript_17271/g.43093 Transcript_17271/m.43093 type:complete len:396 (+) Transcript_17271:176-1363(+)